jgi:hypothetical protein
MATDLQEWILERSGGIRSMQIAWERAILVAESAGWSAETVVGIGENLERPASFVKLCESVALEGEIAGDTVLRKIETRANNSNYSTSDWVRALETLLQFLIRENRSSKLEVQLGFLACSGEYLSSSESPFSFEEGVSGFLAEYGFEG